MPRDRIAIIDGYNAIRRVGQWDALFRQDRARAREALVAHCAAWLHTRKDLGEVVVVFDGDSAVQGVSPSSAAGVRIVFTRTGEPADARMLDMIRRHPAPRRIIAVSDDAEIVRGARANGAEALPVAEFRRAPSKPRRAAPPGDEKLSPQEAGRVNEWLRKQMGLGSGR